MVDLVVTLGDPSPGPRLEMADGREHLSLPGVRELLSVLAADAPRSVALRPSPHVGSWEFALLAKTAAERGVMLGVSAARADKIELEPPVLNRADLPGFGRAAVVQSDDVGSLLPAMKHAAKLQSRFPFGHLDQCSGQDLTRFLHQGWSFLGLTADGNGMHATVGRRAALCAVPTRTERRNAAKTRYLPCAHGTRCVFDSTLGPTRTLIGLRDIRADLLMLRSCRAVVFGGDGWGAGWTLGSRAIAGDSGIRGVLTLASENATGQAPEPIVALAAARALAGERWGDIWLETQMIAGADEIWCLLGDPLARCAGLEAGQDGELACLEEVPPGFHVVRTEKLVTENGDLIARDSGVWWAAMGKVGVVANLGEVPVALCRREGPSSNIDVIADHDLLPMLDTKELIDGIENRDSALGRYCGKARSLLVGRLATLQNVRKRFGDGAQQTRVDPSSLAAHGVEQFAMSMACNKQLVKLFGALVAHGEARLDDLYDSVRSASQIEHLECPSCGGLLTRVLVAFGNLYRTRASCASCRRRFDVPGNGTCARIDVSASAEDERVVYVRMSCIGQGTALLDRPQGQFVWEGLGGRVPAAKASVDVGRAVGGKTAKSWRITFSSTLSIPDDYRGGALGVAGVCVVSGGIYVARVLVDYFELAVTAKNPILDARNL